MGVPNHTCQHSGWRQWIGGMSTTPVRRRDCNDFSKKENKSRYFPPLEWFLRAWKFRRVEPKHATARFVIPYQCAKHKFLFIVREVKKKGRRWRSSCWYIHLYIQYISSRDCWTGYLVLRGEGKKGSGSNPEIKAQPSPIGNLINTK